MITLLGVAISVLIRLKNVTEEPSTRLPTELKDGIVAIYTTTILMAKAPLPHHTLVSTQYIFVCIVLIFRIQTILNDFIATYVTRDDFTTTILPTIEKGLLRSPENCLLGTKPLALVLYSF